MSTCPEVQVYVDFNFSRLPSGSVNRFSSLRFGWFKVLLTAPLKGHLAVSVDHDEPGREWQLKCHL